MKTKKKGLASREGSSLASCRHLEWDPLMLPADGFFKFGKKKGGREILIKKGGNIHKLS